MENKEEYVFKMLNSYESTINKMNCENRKMKSCIRFLYVCTGLLAFFAAKNFSNKVYNAVGEGMDKIAEAIAEYNEKQEANTIDIPETPEEPKEETPKE